jgi:hypothetical protein
VDGAAETVAVIAQSTATVDSLGRAYGYFQCATFVKGGNRMLSTTRYSIALILGSTALLTLVACGGGNSGGDGPAPAVNPLSLNGIVVGMADNSVPAGTNIPVTMTKQVRDLFDRIKNAPDFTKLSYDLATAPRFLYLAPRQAISSCPANWRSPCRMS